MSVYSVKIIESAQELINGVPRTITISSSIPAVIFYDFDQTASSSSSVYMNKIHMPTRTPINLSLFVSNGTDTFQVNYQYRNAFITATDIPAEVNQYNHNPYPFGDINSEGVPGLPGAFVTSGGDPLSTPYNTTGYSTGYDSDGYPTGFTNKPYNFSNYNIKAEYYNKNGQPVMGVGFVPAKSTIQQSPSVPVVSKTSDLFFDPRALVIYQDSSKDDPTRPPEIMKQHFSLPLASNNSDIKDFKKYYRTGDESFNTGSFIRQYFNPKENTLTYCYHDQRSNRWIFSTEKYIPGKLTYTNYFTNSHGLPVTIVRRPPQFSRRTNFS